MPSRTLDQITIPTACSADWNEMKGDESVRFCQHCARNVYNLSEMTKKQANALINSTEGRLCARFYRRPDGSIVTADCASVWDRTRKGLHRAAAALLSASVFTTVAFAQKPPDGLVQIQPSAKGATVVTGIVADQSGSAVPRARVTITNTVTSAKTSLVTDDSGTFRSLPLEPGAYSLMSESPGFKTFLATFTVSGGREQKFDVLLLVGSTGGAIFVEAAPSPKQMAKRLFQKLTGRT